MSFIYICLKDTNEWLVENTKNPVGQKVQDVSLLPQRPTCFTPDGCKEGKIKNYVFEIKSRMRPISILPNAYLPEHYKIEIGSRRS